MVSEVLIFHEDIELLYSGDSYDISLGNIDTAEWIILVLVVIPVRNKFSWVKVAKED